PRRGGTRPNPQASVLAPQPPKLPRTRTPSPSHPPREQERDGFRRRDRDGHHRAAEQAFAGSQSAIVDGARRADQAAPRPARGWAATRSRPRRLASYNAASDFST